jgi:hypothetical protein
LQELTEDGLGGLFVIDCHGGELLLQPSNVSFDVVMVVIIERVGAMVSVNWER